jgi:hypothetical protein
MHTYSHIYHCVIGNDLTPISLDFFRDACSNGMFKHLRLLDLRNNEMGDSCADAVTRLIIQGHLRSIHDVRLQGNKIHDLGFLKVVKVLTSVHEALCPDLRVISLEGNIVSPAARKQVAPLPGYVVV